MSESGPPPGTPAADDRPPLEPLRQVDQGRVLVDRHVLELVRAHVASDSSVEHGGILVGHVDPDAGITIVIDAIRGVGTVTRSASLTFTHETWDHVNDVMGEKYPDAKMVGWYHSHPGFGIFLSDYDQFIHRNFFVERWQVAYVDDPVLDRWGFFGWDGDELVRFTRWGTWSTDEGDGPMAPPGATATPPPPSSPPPAEPAPPAGPVITVEADPEPASTRTWLFGAGAFLACALVAFGLFTLLFGGGDDGPEEAGSAAAGAATIAPSADLPPEPPATTSPPTSNPANEQAPAIVILNSSSDRDDNNAACGAENRIAELVASIFRVEFDAGYSGNAESTSQEQSVIYLESDGFGGFAEELIAFLELGDVEVEDEIPNELRAAQPEIEGSDLVVVIGDDHAQDLSAFCG